MSEDLTKRAALFYAGKGWPVLPVHTVVKGKCTCGGGANCRPGKHPRTPHGVKDATTDRKVIEQWFTDWPNANIGIATGRASKIIVVDVDPRNGGMKTLNKLEAELGSIRTTDWVAETGGGGLHFIFKQPSIKIAKSAFGPGIDILGDGSYFVATPSRHSSGKAYKWTVKASLAAPPPELPGAYLKFLSQDKATAGASLGKPPAASEGQRNTVLTSMVGAMLRAGMDRDAIAAAARAQNLSFSPPLDEQEVNSVIESVLRYPSGRATQGGGDPARDLMERVLAAEFAGGDHLVYTSGTFWRFSGRCWEEMNEKGLHKLLLSAITATGITERAAPLIREASMLMEARLAHQDDPLRHRAEPFPVVNCRNGEVWIGDNGTIDFRPHSPSSYQQHILDIDYDPAAVCPQFDQALLGIFAKTGAAEQMAQFWTELMGYIIQPRRPHAIVPLLSGTGNNGKTKLKDCIVQLLGLHLVYAGQVQRLSTDRFIIGNLFGKLLFVDDDVTAGIRLPDGDLKTISEEKILSGDIKYRSPITFKCRTVPMLLCNGVPSLADLSHGMLRRLVVIPFNRRFTAKTADPTLFTRIGQNEMAGVLNRALEGYGRLVQRGRFQLPPPVVRATREWVCQANPAATFVHECCTRDLGGRVLISDLYEAFIAWAREAGITRPQQRTNFSRNMEALGYEVKHTNRGNAAFGLMLKG